MDYTNEPAHSSSLLTREAQPFNAEPCTSELIEHPVTPERLMYCRNHGEIYEQKSRTPGR
jgi:sulfite oxidase